ncbi:MAG: ParA family protein [Actinomycetota bacterium]|nr:ParA family protein [Actinomycetota bacterium]MDA2949297.1 ParA family protein [Actinomycetota bacterium]MDA2990014.1 ParA family protein [Actinomycetota bacterium]
MAITAFANQKGGVGKSLIAMGCAHAAAADGRRVLLIDADPQGNTSIQMTNGEISLENPSELSLADVLNRHSKVSIEKAIRQSRRPGIDLLPCGFDALQAAQDALVGKPGAENSLKRQLEPIADRWDAVFIDTRPATDLLTINALMAADKLVMILEPEIGAVRGAQQTHGTIADLEEYLQKGLVTAGVVINRVDNRRNDHLQMIEQIRRMSHDEDIAILGEPIPLMADLSKLSAVGMGLDEHPKQTPRTRNIAEVFHQIVKGIEAA